MNFDWSASATASFILLHNHCYIEIFVRVNIEKWIIFCILLKSKGSSFNFNSTPQKAAFGSEDQNGYYIYTDKVIYSNVCPWKYQLAAWYFQKNGMLIDCRPVIITQCRWSCLYQRLEQFGYTSNCWDMKGLVISPLPLPVQFHILWTTQCSSQVTIFFMSLKNNVPTYPAEMKWVKIERKTIIRKLPKSINNHKKIRHEFKMWIQQKIGRQSWRWKYQMAQPFVTINGKVNAFLYRNVKAKMHTGLE